MTKITKKPRSRRTYKAANRMPNGRFKPGVSGNPRGGTRRIADDLVPPTVASLLFEALNMKVPTKGPKGMRELPYIVALIQAYLLKTLHATPAQMQRTLEWIAKSNLLQLAREFGNATRDVESMYELLRSQTRGGKAWEELKASLLFARIEDDEDMTDEDRAAVRKGKEMEAGFHLW